MGGYKTITQSAAYPFFFTFQGNYSLQVCMLIKRNQSRIQGQICEIEGQGSIEKTLIWNRNSQGWKKIYLTRVLQGKENFFSFRPKL